MTAGNTSNPLQSAIADAARVICTADVASLATLDRASGHPYVSLVTVARDGSGAPLLLLSKLARHTQNLIVDPRASLLVAPSPIPSSADDTMPLARDPLALARVTLMGEVTQSASPLAKARFLAHHPNAAVYADFTDFAFYSLTVASAHFIGGFGRIIEIPGPELMSALISQPS